MKQITAIFLCLLFGAMFIAQAQGLRVSVLNDAKESLPHAYIYINGRAVAVADTLGLAVIPQDKLRIGDTISVSYVATEGQSVAVDQNLSTEGEYRFILPEIYATLRSDVVIVKADIEKLYLKYVKQRYPLVYFSLWSSDFSMNISKQLEDRSRTVDGKLKLAYAAPYNIAYSLNTDPKRLDSLIKIWGHYGMNFNNQLPLEITTSDDTTGLSHTLKYFLPNALNVGRWALQRVKDSEPYKFQKEKYPDAKVTYGYLGKDERHRIFRLTYSGFEMGVTRQIVAKCDVKSGDVHEITQNIVNINTGIISYLNAKIDKTKNRYFPIELECRVESNSEVIDVTMKNINIKPFGKPKEKLEQTIRRMMRTGELE